MVAEAEPPAAPRRHRGRACGVEQRRAGRAPTTSSTGMTWNGGSAAAASAPSAERGQIGTQAAQGRETRLQA